VFDVLFTGATVVDGTGAGRTVTDVAVAGDRIALVGPAPEGATARRVVDCAGACLAPGFIDVHTHADHLPFVDPAMGSALRQGVTSVVVGNCGDSLWPPGEPDTFGPFLAELGPGLCRSWGSFGDYLDAIDACRSGANVASLVGHGSVRAHVLESERREADAGEVRAMRAHVRDALADGAVGLSSGLIYQPGLFADTDELVGVASAVAECGGLYTSHIRGEGSTLFRAVAEAVEVGRRAGAHVHISHLKLAAAGVWHRAAELLGFIHDAGATADQYPYTAGLTDLASLLPPWAPADRFDELRADRARLTRLQESVEHGEPDWVGAAEGVGWDHLVPVGPVGEGEDSPSLAVLARERGETPVETMLDLLDEDREMLVLIHAMQADDVRAIMRDPDVMVASDSIPAPDDERWSSLRDHPRSYGTFPRVLGHYARDEGVLPLEAAVRKMTSLPAERFGLRDRGRVAQGSFADLTLFDPDEIAGGGDFLRPHAAPRGIRLVLVNGRVAWDGTTCTRADRALRRTT